MRRFLISCLLLAIAGPTFAGGLEDHPEVRIESGTIRGYVDRGILAFTNIPYCKSERFMPPQKPDHWEGVLDCNTFPPRSMQYMGEGEYDPKVVSEDGAAKLNVWTKSTEGKKPVMVWLHGGGFSSGAGYANPNDSGTGLARQDVVVVSVNHRLDILGFLDLSAYGEKYKYSGNVGMMDIVLALEWVRDNISKFGGDPSNVTIFGESGGGGKVGTLLCMPSAKGLFHKAIIQSGTLLNDNTQKITREYAALTLKNLGLSANDVDKLKDIPYLQLYKAGHDAIREISGQRRAGFSHSWGFAPTLDGVILVQQPFQPAFASFSDDIPIIIGTDFNELERSYYGEKPTMEEAKKILHGIYGGKTDAYIKAFSKAYPEYNTPADMLSVDKTFRPATVAAADAHADKKVSPIYMYIFAWKTPLNRGTIGSAHAYELPFVFHMTEVSAKYLGRNTPEVQSLADKMSHAWVSFAYTGRPEVEGLDWEPYTSSKGAIMYFNNKCEMRYNYDRDVITIMQNRNPEYWLGADISSANGMKVRGKELKDFTGEKTYELTDLMKRLGLNAARYRVWVEPSRKGGAGSCDKEDLLQNCLLAKKLGLEIMVSFHYSDTWADPKHQPIPKSWMGHDYQTMKQDVYNHTYEVLQYLKDNGVEPKWVQIGNETRNGLLWNPAELRTGEKADPNNIPVAEHMGHSKLEPEHYAGFINEGCKAAKAVFPKCITLVHLDNGYDQAMYDWNLGILEKYGVDYDMVGMSLYPYWAAQEGGRNDADGVIEDCAANVKHVYKRFGKESMIVETGFEVNEQRPEVMEESYRQLSKAIEETRYNTEGHCHGIFYWAPEIHPGKDGRTFYKLGAFGSDLRPTKIMKAFVEAAEDSR